MVQTASDALAEKRLDHIRADILFPSTSDWRREVSTPMQHKKDRNAAEIGRTCGGCFIVVKTGQSANVQDKVHSWPMSNAHDSSETEEDPVARSTGKHFSRIL